MKQAWIVAVSVLLVALGIVALAWWFWPQGEDPQVASVRQLGEQLFERRESLSDTERRALFQNLRTEMEQLSPEQRQQLRSERSNAFRARMEAEVKQFHSLPPEKRAAYLDERIDAMEAMRRQAAARRAANGVRDRDRSLPTFGAGQGDRGGRGQGRWGRSQEERDQRRRQRLDGSTARERAEFTSFFEALRQRRKERGLPDFRTIVR